MKNRLETLYKDYNRRRYVHPDPLEFLYNYKDIQDREIAGLIASSLAFGRVEQILLNVNVVLKKMDPSPYYYLQHSSYDSIRNDYKGFVYRFVGEKDITNLLYGVKQVLSEFGTLKACFLSGLSHDDETVLPSMSFFVKHFSGKNCKPGYLLAIPDKGSACKRMNLFLRWMVRKDEVDPGGWGEFPASKLIVPLDTHMHKIGLKLGLTNRKQANMRTALEITEAFRQISPDDPVKYDFSLTRFGIRSELDISDI